MDMRDGPESYAMEESDEVLAALVAEQLQWSSRPVVERHAFNARLFERLERRSGWLSKGFAFATPVAAALAAIVLSLPVAPPQAPAADRAGFLVVAYYAGDRSAELHESYLPGDYGTWAEALETPEEVGRASL
jgi:hypothetical protein